MDQFGAKTQELHSPFARKKARTQTGAEAVAVEIDSLNRRYKGLSANIDDKIEKMASLGSESNVSSIRGPGCG